jgi:cytochrome c-type biogenesis protein CcmH/NrfG
MQCKDVAQAIEQDGFSPVPEAARGHVAGCAACSSLVADFESILAAASQLPSDVEPPSRVWVALRAQLVAEKIIKEPRITVPVEKSPRWQGFGQLIRGRVLALSAVAVVMIFAAGYFQMTHRQPSAPLADATPVVKSEPVLVEPFAAAALSLDQEEQSLGPMQTVSTGVTSASPVDNSLRENLATLNTFIKECRKRLQEDPNDQVARDYLAAAYQQKAEILAAMMERGRSVN